MQTQATQTGSFNPTRSWEAGFCVKRLTFELAGCRLHPSVKVAAPNECATQSGYGRRMQICQRTGNSGLA